MACLSSDLNGDPTEAGGGRGKKVPDCGATGGAVGGARPKGARRLREHETGREAGSVGRSRCGNQAGSEGWRLIRSEQDRVWIWGF